MVLPREFVMTSEILELAPLLKAVARLHGNTDYTDFDAEAADRVRPVQHDYGIEGTPVERPVPVPDAPGR